MWKSAVNREGAAPSKAVPSLRVLLSVLLMKDRGPGSPLPARIFRIQRAGDENKRYLDQNYQ